MSKSYCGSQGPGKDCWCDAGSVSTYNDHCSDIATVCSEIVSQETFNQHLQAESQKTSAPSPPAKCEAYGSPTDTYCDDTEENCASGYKSGSAPECKECTTGKWKDCKTTATKNLYCTGAMKLQFSESTVSPGASVVATVSGLSNCDGKVANFFGYPYDEKNPTCTIKDGGCSISLKVSDNKGDYYYGVTVDLNGDGQFSCLEEFQKCPEFADSIISVKSPTSYAKGKELGFQEFNLEWGFGNWIGEAKPRNKALFDRYLIYMEPEWDYAKDLAGKDIAPFFKPPVYKGSYKFVIQNLQIDEKDTVVIKDPDKKGGVGISDKFNLKFLSQDVIIYYTALSGYIFRVKVIVGCATSAGC